MVLLRTVVTNFTWAYTTLVFFRNLLKSIIFVSLSLFLTHYFLSGSQRGMRDSESRCDIVHTWAWCFMALFMRVCTWHCRSHFHRVLCRIFISWRLRMCNYDAAQKLVALPSEDMSMTWTVCLTPARRWDNGGESRRDGVFPWCSNCSAAVTAGLGCCHVSVICSICESLRESGASFLL